MKKTLIGLIGVLLLLVACGQQPGSNSSEPIKLGVIGPLTGDVASIGQSMQRAYQLAAEEVNVEGGIHGRQVQLIFEDGRCNGKDGSNAANKLANIDKVSVILGAGCSPETLAAAPITEAAKIILLSSISSNPDVSKAGDYVFRDYPSDAYMGKFAAEYAYTQLGKRKVATLYCLNDFCTAIKKVFKNRFEELGGKVITEESFEPDSKDLRTQLTKIKETQPDIIYFLAFTDASVIGIVQAKELGIDVPLLGGDPWSDPDIHKKTGDAAEGILWAEPYTPLSEEFKNKIYAKFGQVDLTTGTGQAYDALHIIAKIMRKVGTDSTKIKDELYQVKDYPGVSGTIGFDENGDLLEARYIIHTLKNGKVEDAYK
ncbi:MAG TPA: ABC transporter substrate-binding protein [Candidatus Nanoarchaeia archaeon]|nr:ABC transporter substrate-binding protein [Candidatus Nanoarchaeia archaeon]